jgi:hypothetical protein
MAFIFNGFSASDAEYLAMGEALIAKLRRGGICQMSRRRSVRAIIMRLL